MAYHVQKRLSLALALTLMLSSAALAATTGRGSTGSTDGRSGRSTDVTTSNTGCVTNCSEQVRKPLKKVQERCDGTVADGQTTQQDCHPRRHKH